MSAPRPPFSRLLSRLSGVPALFAATFFLTLSGAHPAMAQTVSTLGDVFCEAAVNIVPYIDVFNMAAYVIGAFFIVQAVLHMKNHYDNPGQYPHHKTFALFGGGAALMLLPTFASMLIDTLFISAGGGGLDACVSAEAPAATGSGIGLDVMMQNFVNNIQQPLEFLVSSIAILLGVFLIVRGLMKASKYGTDPRTTSPTHILTNLVVGTVLVVVGQSVDVIMQSVFGTAGMEAYSPLSWSGLNGFGDTTHFQQAVQAALTFVQLVGFISFVRGWNVIRHAVEGTGQATVPQGLTHIIGGVLAININAFLQIMDKTFGTGFFT